MLINAHPIGEFSSPVIAAITFATLLLAAQMFVQITASALVSQNVFLDSFMSNLDIGVSFQPIRNLLWAPSLLEFALSLSDQVSA